MAGITRTTGQHHGDLRNALLDVAYVLIDERGLNGWTLTDAARASSVSVAAPYKHFADRDALLAGLATRGLLRLTSRLRIAMEEAADPSDALARFAAAYGRFAREERPHFEAAFAVRRVKSSFPDLVAASTEIFELLLPSASSLVGPDRATELALAVGALAHGFAALSVLEVGSTDGTATDEDRASRAIRDLARGSEARILGTPAP